MSASIRTADTMATNGSFSQQEQYTATSGSAESTTGTASGQDLSKDEVGWYFVEQYYTTLSKSPEKLHVSSRTVISESRALIVYIALLWETFPVRLRS